MKECKILCIDADVMSVNLGCSALGLSFISILEDIAKQNDLHIDLNLLCYGNTNFTLNKNNIQVHRPIQIKYKDPRLYLKTREIAKVSNVIIDFTGGDSFTDIYKDNRFIKEISLMKIAIHTKKPFIMAPQTIGPFDSYLSQIIARSVLRRAFIIFTRDRRSHDYTEKVLKCKNVLTTDVAFSLKANENFAKDFSFDQKLIKIGLNVSGLLWHEKINNKNNFKLYLNYRDYIKKLITACNLKGYQVHLIPHVINVQSNTIDNDYFVSQELHKQYSYTVLAPNFSNPMQAKAYMSYMDFFIGSRMHATVGAFSMGVPTVAVAYSRKFSGLYDSINYRRTIEAKNVDTEDALKETFKLIEKRTQLKEEVNSSLSIAKSKNKEFKTILTSIILDHCV